MNLNQLRYILAVAEEGSFTKADEKLFISQPSLSEQVKKFEEEYHVSIFKRSRGRKIELTEAGNIAVKYALEIAQSKRRLEHDLFSITAKHDGKIRIGVFITFFYQAAAEIIKDFQVKYPNIHICYTILTSNSLFKQLIDDQLDLIFITEEPDFKTLQKNKLVTELIACEPFQAIMNVKHHLARKESLTWSDFDKQSIMLCSQDSLSYPLLVAQLQNQHAIPNVIGYSSQVDINCQIARNNLAIGFISRASFDNYNDKAGLKALPVTPEIVMEVHMVYKKNSDNCWLDTFTKFIIDKAHFGM